MARISHNPRCAIFNEPPGLRDANDCNCGAISPLRQACDFGKMLRPYAVHLGTVDDPFACAGGCVCGLNEILKAQDEEGEA